jgi:hypothetical protein
MLEVESHSNIDDIHQQPPQANNHLINHLIVATCVSSLINRINNTPAERRKPKG